MASAPTLVANPTNPAQGGSSTITAGFTLSPGGVAHVTLSINGGPVAMVDVTEAGEAFPSIKMAGDPTIGPNDYVLASTLGTLSKVDATNYKLQF